MWHQRQQRLDHAELFSTLEEFLILLKGPRKPPLKFKVQKCIILILKGLCLYYEDEQGLIQGSTLRGFFFFQ